MHPQKHMRIIRKIIKVSIYRLRNIVTGPSIPLVRDVDTHTTDLDLDLDSLIQIPLACSPPLHRTVQNWNLSGTNIVYGPIIHVWLSAELEYRGDGCESEYFCPINPSPTPPSVFCS